MLNKKNTNRFKKGQTLIEVLIAAAIVVLISVSLISASLISVKDSKFSQNQSIATDLSQKMVEEVRVERDKRITANDWAGFNALAGTGSACYGYSGDPESANFILTAAVSCASASVFVTIDKVDFFPLTKLQRIPTNKVGVYAICVLSTVRFDDSTGARYSKKKTILTDWTQGAINDVTAELNSCNNSSSDFSF